MGLPTIWQKSETNNKIKITTEKDLGLTIFKELNTGGVVKVEI
jgi:hypothetical protein